MWSRGHRFVVAAQDDLPVTSIANDRAPVAKARSLEDKRNASSAAACRDPSWKKAERNLRLGQRMQFVFAAIMSMIAASEVRQALASPLGSVGRALER